MSSHEQKHPYHLVNPSPWPLLSAFAGGLLAFGLILLMHDETPVVAYLGVASVVGVMFGWWRDVVREAEVEKVHTPVVRIGLRYGVLLFILSELMFFAGFFWAYFDASLFAEMWPPEGIKAFDPLDLPLLNTLILLLSGCTVTWAHYAVVHNDRKGLQQGLLYSVILGFIFLALQMFEYSHAAFGFKDGIYASTFYMATGFHGFHVFVGTVFLLVCYLRSLKGHFTADQHVGFEAAAWYWHFVDVVWLFLFVAIYMGSAI